MEKETYKIKIIDIDNLGNGITKIDNIVTFIKGALIDEEIEIKIISKSKRYQEGKIISIIKPSPLRTSPICSHFNICGGCSFLHIENTNELGIKQNYINNLFKDIKVNSIVSVNELYYRNKVTFHIKNNKIGYYKENTNELVEINKCYLLDKDIDNIFQKIKKLNLTSLEEVIIRKSIANNNLLIEFKGNINEKELQELKKTTNISSIYINNKLIFGDKYLIEQISNYKFSIAPTAFFQVNYDLMINLFDKIKSFAQGDKLLDLYCGTGIIGVLLRENFNKVTGVEISNKAIENANINKELNNITNINFICSDVDKIKDKHYDFLVVDPPRSGLNKTVIKNIINMQPRNIIYISCNPNTLKRDLELLKEEYNIKEITPYNMFPKTNHIECLTSLSLKQHK